MPRLVPHRPAARRGLAVHRQVPGTGCPPPRSGRRGRSACTSTVSRPRRSPNCSAGGTASRSEPGGPPGASQSSPARCGKGFRTGRPSFSDRCDVHHERLVRMTADRLMATSGSPAQRSSRSDVEAHAPQGPDTTAVVPARPAAIPAQPERTGEERPPVPGPRRRPLRTGRDLPGGRAL